jgi:4,5-dihydroxyphthalate decarboxylase
LQRASIVIGKHPQFGPLRSGEVRPERLDHAFEDVEPTNRAFAPMLREGRYDISEIAITVFLQAIEAGRPVRLLPVVAMGGSHHGSIYRNPQAGPLAPGDLAGRRVAVRAYSQTTGLYVRGILAEEHGVDADAVTWVTTEGSHVAEYVDPPNVERTDESVTDLLKEGRVDAAILAPGREPEPWCVPLIPDADEAGRRWVQRHGLVPINHLVCVGPSIYGSPELVEDLVATFRRAGDSSDRTRIETAIAYALGLAREQHQPVLVAFGLMIAARLVLPRERPADAVMLQTQADALLAAADYALYDEDERVRASLMADAARALGEQAYATAVAAGRGLGPDAAADLAEGIFTSIGSTPNTERRG